MLESKERRKRGVKMGHNICNKDSESGSFFLAVATGLKKRFVQKTICVDFEKKVKKVALLAQNSFEKQKALRTKDTSFSTGRRGQLTHWNHSAPH